MKRLAAFLRRLVFLLIVGVIGFIAGGVTLYVIILRSGPPLRAWHATVSSAEFTVEQAAEVRDLDGYRQLEDRLFAEVDEAVFPATGTGPDFALERFSAGSLSDPRGYDVDWNRTFEQIPATPVGGALLLHGMSDSPYSMRAIGAFLFARGYHVVGLRVPGHGTTPAGLTTARWQDMAAAVELGVRDLHESVGGKPIHLVGYSNGAALAVNYCLDVLDGSGEPMPASLVLLSPAIGVSPLASFAQWQELASGIPGLEKLAWTDVLPEYDPYKYNSFAVNAGKQVHLLTSSLASRIEARAVDGPIDEMPPTLALLSTVDATVTADAVVDNLLEHLAPGRHEMVLFDVNRAAAAASLLVEDPGPLTARMIADERLPFALTLITNETPESTAVVAHHKIALSAEVSTEPLGLSWPVGVLSLSHVALPFPPDDPLYGRQRPKDRDRLYLGHVSVQGERGLLRIPSDTLLRLRHNPFFEVVERRVVGWVEAAGGR